MSTFNARKLLQAVTLGIAAFLLGSPGAKAQETLEEIIVTAQKREENIISVPISITKMSEDRLTARFLAGADILALANAAPGLHIESSNGRLAPRFYLRGLGNADFTAAASQPVSVVFDDVPMEKSATKAFPLFDLDSVEVIRGPQGTLFGRNTTAGIVKVNTRRPTEETEGFFKVSAGEKSTFTTEGALGGTIADGMLMARASFLTQHKDDWVDNAFTGESDALGGHNINAARLQLLWTPTENFSALLLHQQQDQEGTCSLFRANVFDKGSNEPNANYIRDVVFFDGGANNPCWMKSRGTNLTLDLDLGNNYTLTSITSYQDIYDRFGRGDIDGGYGCLFTCGGGDMGPPSTPFRPVNSPVVVNVDTGGGQVVTQLTQEVRLASDLDGPLNYQVGYFYFEDSLDSTSSSQNAGATEFLPNSFVHIDNTSWSIFGQGSFDLSDQMTLTAGLRYTTDEKDANHIDYTGAIDPAPISLRDNYLSWDLALSYAISDDAQVYTRFATGFRAPTIQDRIQDDVEVTTADSETIFSGEVGYKAQFERARFSAAAFYYAIDDMQLVAVGGTSNSTALLNANEGIGYGIELEIDYAASDNLILSGGLGYAETEINDPTLSVPGGPMVTILDPLDANGFALIDGNAFQHAPKWTANLELAYTYPLSESRELYLFTDWKFKGETQDFLYESAEYIFDAQHEGGLRFGYRDTEGKFEVGVFGRNITDEHNFIGGIDFANNLGYTNEPRIWGVEAMRSF